MQSSSRNERQSPVHSSVARIRELVALVTRNPSFRWGFMLSPSTTAQRYGGELAQSRSARMLLLTLLSRLAVKLFFVCLGLFLCRPDDPVLVMRWRVDRVERESFAAGRVDDVVFCAGGN